MGFKRKLGLWMSEPLHLVSRVPSTGLLQLIDDVSIHCKRD